MGSVRYCLFDIAAARYHLCYVHIFSLLLFFVLLQPLTSFCTVNVFSSALLNEKFKWSSWNPCCLHTKLSGEIKSSTQKYQLQQSFVT